MKKTLSCFLALIMILSCFSVIGFAGDDYTRAYTVALDSSSAGIMELVTLDPEILEPIGANYTDTFGYFIPENETAVPGTKTASNKAVIAVRAAYTNRLDQTSCIKVFPKTKNVDILNGVEYETRPEILNYDPVSAYGTPLHMEILKNKGGFPIDENGNLLNVKKDTGGNWVGADSDKFIFVAEFYCVTEDIVVGVYNVSDESISDVKDFLFNMFNFFVNLIKWFFGLTTAKPQWPV